MRSTTIVSTVSLVAVVSAAVILAMSQQEQDPPEPATPVAQGARLFRIQGCAVCHAIGNGASRGPNLAGLVPRLEQRLDPEQYQRQMAGIRTKRPDVYQQYEGVYTDILARDGEERLRAWLTAHLRNPRFDFPEGKMPNYGHLTPQQVESLIEFLLTLK